MAERDTRGRFIKGNRGGPGRPKRVLELQFLAALHSRVTPKAWREIVDAVIRKARAGDVAAASWVARFVVGTPDPFASLPEHHARG